MKLPEKPPLFEMGKYDFRDILRELQSLGKFGEFFEAEGYSYPYWEKWKYKAKEWGMDSEKIWHAAKFNRIGRLVFLTDRYIFHLNAPSVVQQQLHELDMNLGGSIQSDRIIPAREKEKYLLSSLIEEAIASSQLEGATTTRKVAREMLEMNRKPVNQSEQMILNNYQAMQWIVENKDLPINKENILELHRIITRDTLSSSDHEGVFRKVNDVNVVDAQTGEIVHHPPPYEDLDMLMDGFFEFANDRDTNYFFIHPIAKGIILHFFTGFIHPFVDGNGRTARTIFYWYLLKKGYWLIEYISVSRVLLKAKAKYARAYLYTEYDENDLTYFVIYNLQCLINSLEELKQHIQRKSAEKNQVMDLLHRTRFNERQMVLLQELLQDQGRYFTVTQVEKWFAISNQTARNDLNGLVEANLLAFRKNGNRIQYFAARDFSGRLEKLA